MNMYFAFLLGAFALWVLPDRNILNVPFADLTLSLIGKTTVFLWAAYSSLKLAGHSFAEDKFWPWRWNKKIMVSLLARAGMLAFLAAGAWAFTEHKKLGPMVNEYPIISGILLLAVVTWITCVSDEELFSEPKDSKS